MKTLITLGMILTVAGCGSSNGSTDAASSTNGPGGKRDSGASACTALSPAGAKMSWQDNDTAECAIVVVATRTSNPTLDFIEIIGSTSTGIEAGLTVAAYTGTLAGGTYHCKSDAGASLFVDFVYAPGTIVDCTITITNPGTPGSANATGTFSAIVTASGGGTTTVTNGSFDTPVTATSG